EDPDIVRDVLALGVAGYIPKTDPPAVVVSAVQLMLAGGSYVPPRLIRNDGAPQQAQAMPSFGLTSRQLEVLRLLAQGLPNKAIARELGVSDGTVKVHLLAVFRALNVRNRTAAVIAARDHLS
ncbi:MAG TPA: response regulator transcription factor, partial [Casimicrobiaceae bacterium]|nr:response regulator transcription factor [Casimicrobiaceae bacterium]